MVKTRNNVEEKTLKYDLCINCGVCKIVCPVDAISMQRNKYGEINPVINDNKCTNCGLCSKYCPNTNEKRLEESKKISSIQEAHTFGLQNASYYIAWDSNKIQRQKCCSGGAVTKIACYLLENKIVDGMIHVERLWGKKGDLHYGARLSTSVNEIKEHVSSAYQPIDFSEVLKKLEKGKTYFLTGTPCVIKGLKNLFKNHKDFSSINILTCALVCSHNVNSQFIDYFTDHNKINNSAEWKINIRQKDDSIKDANNFQNHIYTKDKDLLIKNRHESGWTHIWRSYYFAMNCCLYCSDFWGYEADISVKDAWGKWAKDPLGKSIVIVRNNDFNKYIKECSLETESLDYETIKSHQYNTSDFKQNNSPNKNTKSIFYRKNRKCGLFKYKIISVCSKFLYKNFGYKFTSVMMHGIEFISERIAKL